MKFSNLKCETCGASKFFLQFDIQENAYTVCCSCGSMGLCNEIVSGERALKQEQEANKQSGVV